MKRIWVLSGLLYSLSNVVFANGVNFQFLGGKGWASLDHRDSIFLNPFVQNTYKLSRSPNTSFYGIGVGYQWLISKMPNFAFDLGISAYHNRVHPSGMVYPFSNAGQFDTLNFYATNKAYSVLLEPKLTYARYWVKPYIFLGLGLGWNKTSNYSESPTNPALSAVPMSQPFGNKSKNDVAYEAGFGLKTEITSYHQTSLYLLLDYRYLNWGDMALANSPIQSTNRGPRLGSLVTNQFSIGLNYQFG